ncbi:MAG: preprotein translocase, SecG subunit [Chloroflexi bacterium]|nr:preprotein translocase, SecG subunit [Chloroflexota bacterium]MDB5073849.1 preprotein translocase, SecG subunit [Chloroflexota bacterium]
MLTALRIVQALLAIFLTILILMQSRGTGLGSVFGGDANVFQTRRGIELTLFKFTIGVAAAFLLISLLVISKFVA